MRVLHDHLGLMIEVKATIQTASITPVISSNLKNSHVKVKY